MIEYPTESSAEVIVELDEKKLIKVLHVDDEPSLLKIAKQCLEMQGSFQIDTASSVEEAMNDMHDAYSFFSFICSTWLASVERVNGR